MKTPRQINRERFRRGFEPSIGSKPSRPSLNFLASLSHTCFWGWHGLNATCLTAMLLVGFSLSAINSKTPRPIRVKRGRLGREMKQVLRR